MSETHEHLPVGTDGAVVATLIERSPGDREHPLGIGSAVLGRGDADVPLDDSDVSRRHAELRIDADAAFIRDLGSKNGVVVDGHRIADEDEHELRDGSLIVTGGVTLELCHDGARVRQALMAAGEVTRTRTRTGPDAPHHPEGVPADAGGRPGVAMPLALAALFFVAAVVLVLYGN